MDKSKYIEDLNEIKDIMSKSSRFISLSGLSGVSTGIIALAGAYLSYESVFKGHEYLQYQAVELSSEPLYRLIFIAFGTLALAVLSALFFTKRKTKNEKQQVWDIQSRRLLINLLIPLITGGILCAMLLFKGFVGILPALTLIFYGLALVNGSHYTLPEIRTLGILQIVLGLLAFQFIHFSLLFWALGFGLVQIIYGLIIQRKY